MCLVSVFLANRDVCRLLSKNRNQILVYEYTCDITISRRQKVFVSAKPNSHTRTCRQYTNQGERGFSQGEIPGTHWCITTCSYCVQCLGFIDSTKYVVCINYN